MSIQQILQLLEFCLTNTYFLFQVRYYDQEQGAAMGYSISPLIANLFMEEFEVKTPNSCPYLPSLWLRFVDDTFVISKAEHRQALLQDINNQDPHIQFTIEEPTQQGTLPFLDTLVTIESNNTFSTSVYRKQTHTDQHLHCDSNHHITAEQSVYNTLAHRAKMVSLMKEMLDKELKHIRGALQACQFPYWALNQLHQSFLRINQIHQDINGTNNSIKDNNNIKKRNISFIQGISEKFKELCKSKGIQGFFKGTDTLRTQLLTSKDKDPKLQKRGIIYHYKCPHINCTEVYIG